MRIRPAAAGDIPAITDIYNHAVLHTTASFDLEPKSIEDRRRWLEGRLARHPVLVAEDGDAIVAWGALSRFSERPAYDATVELSVYVGPDHQRQGIGRALTRALLSAAEDVGVHSVLARICTENEGSISMVRSLGFAEAGTVHEVGHKFGRWLDVATWEYLIEGAGGVS